MHRGFNVLNKLYGEVKGSFSASNAQVISRVSKDLPVKMSPPGFVYAASSIVRASQQVEGSKHGSVMC